MSTILKTFMAKTKFTEEFILYCSCCGSSNFKWNNEKSESEITCIQCEAKFTKNELKSANLERINSITESEIENALNDLLKKF
jgi:hypothetical protein